MCFCARYFVLCALLYIRWDNTSLINKDKEQSTKHQYSTQHDTHAAYRQSPPRPRKQFANLCSCCQRRTRPCLQRCRACDNQLRARVRSPSSMSELPVRVRTNNATSSPLKQSRHKDSRCLGPQCQAPNHARVHKARLLRQSLPKASMPSEPVITAASSERISPNRFSVNNTSKRRGICDQVHRAGINVKMIESRRQDNLRRYANHSLSPQLRSLQHIRFVDRRYFAAAFASRFKCDTARRVQSLRLNNASC